MVSRCSEQVICHGPMVMGTYGGSTLVSDVSLTASLELQILSLFKSGRGWQKPTEHVISQHWQSNASWHQHWLNLGSARSSTVWQANLYGRETQGCQPMIANQCEGQPTKTVQVLRGLHHQVRPETITFTPETVTSSSNCQRVDAERGQK